MRLPGWVELLPPFRGRVAADRQSVAFDVQPRWHRYIGMEFSASPCAVCGLHPDSMIHRDDYREAFLAAFGADD